MKRNIKSSKKDLSCKIKLLYEFPLQRTVSTIDKKCNLQMALACISWIEKCDFCAFLLQENIQELTELNTLKLRKRHYWPEQGF